MRKLVFTILIVALTYIAGSAQNSSAEKQAATNEEMKKEFVSKLSFSEDKAEKILAIENEFYTSLASVKKLAENSEAEKKEKNKQLSAAHVLRRSKLMELPLTGRQMEDTIELSESIRRRHKL